MYSWMLRASFRKDGSLQYTVEPDDYRIITKSFRWWFLRHWSSVGMRKELENLAALIGKMKH